MEIRSEIAKRLERGKVDFLHTAKLSARLLRPNKYSGFGRLFQQVKEASVKLGIAMPDDWFSILLRLPDAMSPKVKR